MTARAAVVLVALVAGALALAHSTGAAAPPAPAAPAPQVLAPGWQPLAFAPPEPGSYALPPLGSAADGRRVRRPPGRLRP